MTATEPVTTPPSPTVTGDPTALFAWFSARRDATPVLLDPAQGVCHVFRYADVSTVLTDHETFGSDFSSIMPADGDFALFSKGNFARIDPPRHHKLRRLASQAFTPRMIDGLAPRISQLVTELLDTAGGGDLDLVDSLTYPLPIIVITEMLGIPTSDRDTFRGWAEALISAMGQFATSAKVTEAAAATLNSTVREMNAYVLEHIRLRRGRPTEDLIGQLVLAEVDGQRLDDEEIVGFVLLLLIAGHITTTTLLGNAVLCLDDHPRSAAELRADPDRLRGALEEVLRYRPPFPMARRLTTREVELGGVTIAERTMVLPWLGSANHDERKFTEPERFDIHRSPNPHTAFGQGIHFCLGAPLARLESKIALEILLRRHRDITVDRAGVRGHRSVALLGPTKLPVHLS